MENFLYTINKKNAYSLSKEFNFSENECEYIRQSFWPIIIFNDVSIKDFNEHLNNEKQKFTEKNKVFDLDIFKRQYLDQWLYDLQEYLDNLKKGKTKVWVKSSNTYFHIFLLEIDVNSNTLILTKKNDVELEIYFTQLVDVIKEFIYKNQKLKNENDVKPFDENIITVEKLINGVLKGKLSLLDAKVLISKNYKNENFDLFVENFKTEVNRYLNELMFEFSDDEFLKVIEDVEAYNEDNWNDNPFFIPKIYVNKKSEWEIVKHFHKKIGKYECIFNVGGLSPHPLNLTDYKELILLNELIIKYISHPLYGFELGFVNDKLKQLDKYPILAKIIDDFPPEPIENLKDKRFKKLVDKTDYWQQDIDNENTLSEFEKAVYKIVENTGNENDLGCFPMRFRMLPRTILDDNSIIQERKKYLLKRMYLILIGNDKHPIIYKLLKEYLLIIEPYPELYSFIITSIEPPQQNTINKTELNEIWLSEPKVTIDEFLRLGIEKSIWDNQYSVITAKGSLYGTGKSMLGSLFIALKGYAISENIDFKVAGKAFCNFFNVPINEQTKEPYKAFSSGNEKQIRELKRAFKIK